MNKFKEVLCKGLPDDIHFELDLKLAKIGADWENLRQRCGCNEPKKDCIVYRGTTYCPVGQETST